jgi:hypothetical protein
MHTSTSSPTRAGARVRLSPALAALAAVALASCGDPPAAPIPDDGAPRATPLAGLQAGPVGGSSTGEFTWVTGQPAVWMGSATGRACFLTSVGGRFNGSSDYVKITVNFGGWYLSGASSGSGDYGVGARARCVPATSYTAEKSASVSPAGASYSGVVLGPGACGLTRIGGRLGQSGDWVLIAGSTPNLIVNSASAYYLGAGARCVTAPALPMTGSATWAYPSAAVLIAGASTSDVCVLNQVRGPFKALADWVHVSKSLSGWSVWGASKFGLRAGAHCFDV